VLPFAVEIGKFQVNELDAIVLDLTKDVLRCFGHGKAFADGACLTGP
jgi:hypothetical protein